MSGRGMITDEIKKISLQRLGYEINQAELRLMPYLQYCVVNNQNIAPIRITQEDREILSMWRNEGYISGGAADFEMTKDFWDDISQLIWLGYVAHD